MTLTVTDCDRNEVWDAAKVIARLEKAGATLMAMRVNGVYPRLAQQRWEVVRSIWEETLLPPRLEIPAPTGEDIDMMDEAFGWVLLIPATMMATRRVVHARSLRHPLTDRYVFGWRKIARAVGSDHMGVQRMHAAGIKIILRGLPNAPK